MSATTVHLSHHHFGCLVCDTCGAIFNPKGTFTIRFNLTTLGGGITPPITRRPGECPGCGRTWELGADTP